MAPASAATPAATASSVASMTLSPVSAASTAPPTITPIPDPSSASNATTSSSSSSSTTKKRFGVTQIVLISIFNPIGLIFGYLILLFLFYGAIMLYLIIEQICKLLAKIFRFFLRHIHPVRALQPPAFTGSVPLESLPRPGLVKLGPDDPIGRQSVLVVPDMPDLEDPDKPHPSSAKTETTK